MTKNGGRVEQDSYTVNGRRVPVTAELSAGWLGATLDAIAILDAVSGMVAVAGPQAAYTFLYHARLRLGGEVE